jgi:hypothetical protein
MGLVTWKYTVKVQKPDEAGQLTRSAFLRWRGMIHEMIAGKNIYIAKQEYPNPPIMALILWPFAALPPLVGAMVWLYVKALLAAVAVIWLLRLASPPPLSMAGQLLGAVIALPALVGDMSHNNVNIFIFFLVVTCLECIRRGWDILGGLCLALGIACKVTPLLFLPYFVWKRAWRVLLGTGVGLFLWLLVIPALVLGWQWNIQLLGDWYYLMVERPVFQGEVVSEHPNQSLVGWTYRLLTHSPSFVRYVTTADGDIPVASAYHNLLEFNPRTAWVLSKMGGIVFLAAMLFLCRTPLHHRQGWARLAEYGWIALGMLLLSERTWKHHAVILAIPGYALAAALAAGVGTAQQRRYWLFSLALALALIIVPGICGRQVQDMALVYGTHTAAFLVLGGVVISLLITAQRTPMETAYPN